MSRYMYTLRDPFTYISEALSISGFKAFYLILINWGKRFLDHFIAQIKSTNIYCALYILVYFMTMTSLHQIK